jgi:hypothetical protein
MLDGVLLTHKHTQEMNAMEETIKEQVSRVQALTDNQKERFLRIYFHEADHSINDDVVLTADPE